MDSIFYFRSIERILVVCFSGISIYLGYRLFSQIPEKTDTEGKIILPGGISIYMSRVGPGVFFALFGLIVLALSLYFSVSIKNTPGGPKILVASANQSAGATSPETIYRGISQHFETNKDILKDNRLNMRPDMYQLNNLMGLIRSDLTETKRSDVERLIKKIKFRMIYSVWSDEWGDYEQFKEWVNGFLPELPKEQKDAAKLYHFGTEND